jgi:hypothetical protein
MHFETKVEIAAPLDHVWRILADVDRWPKPPASNTSRKLLKKDTPREWGVSLGEDVPQ